MSAGLSSSSPNWSSDNLCRSWADALDNFTYHRLPERYTLLSSRQDAEDIVTKIAAEHGELLDHNIYIAGPENLVFASRKVLTGMGVSLENLKTEIVCLGFCSEEAT